LKDLPGTERLEKAEAETGTQSLTTPEKTIAHIAATVIERAVTKMTAGAIGIVTGTGIGVESGTLPRIAQSKMTGHVVTRGIAAMMTLLGAKRRCNVERRNWLVGNKRCPAEARAGVTRPAIRTTLDNVMGFTAEITTNWVRRRWAFLPRYCYDCMTTT
jgi:hypothetical protein